MEQSSEEIRQEHLRLMGRELGTEYNALWKEVIWLHMKWNLYRQLYAHSPERITLLNKAASHVFWVIQESLFDDVLSHLARLTDRRTKDTLTLRRFPRLLSDATLASQVQGLVDVACDACGSAKDHRDRILAHTDRALALGASTDALSEIGYADVEAALQAIRAVMHRLEMHYGQPETAYEHVLPRGGDADSLVHHLREGIRAEKARMERFLQGKPLPEDEL